MGQGEVHLTKGQPPQHSTKLGHMMSLQRGYGFGGMQGAGGETQVHEGHRLGCVGVHLTKGHPAQSSTKLGYRMSLQNGCGGKGQEWAQVCGGVGGTSDQRSA